MAAMTISKPTLPLEILSLIVDHLSAPDMISFARVSRRVCEMVCEDSRWVRRLRATGCWDEGEARRGAGGKRGSRQRVEDVGDRRGTKMDSNVVNGKGRPEAEVLFDASPKEVVYRNGIRSGGGVKRRGDVDGFEGVRFAAAAITDTGAAVRDPQEALQAVKRVRSIRGQARQEYGELYSAVGTFYHDAIVVERPMNAKLFNVYGMPEEQAQMLSQVRMLSWSDFSPGSAGRAEKIDEIFNVFDTSALLEFRQGYEYQDIRGRMRQYARVMHILNGGKSAVDLFLHDNRMIANKDKLGGAKDCVDYSMGYGSLSLEKVQAYFERLANAFEQEASVVNTVFVNKEEVLLRLLEQTGEVILRPFLRDILEDARMRGTSMYLKMISGTFAATKQLITENCLSTDSDEQVVVRAMGVVAKIYEPHLATYLAEELAGFKQKADQEIRQWDQALQEQSASTESFLMSNVNRQADKKDFMSSFRKVVMMPVNLLPSFSSPAAQKDHAKKLVDGEAAASLPPRSSTPNPLAVARSATPSLPVEAPTTELAAKAALMNTRLDNIKALFSIEVALNLVHAAKSSLERVAQFITLGGTPGSAAKQTAASIFITLLQTVGVRHVKTGFDTAISHLAQYNSRSSPTTSSPASVSRPQVASLTTFLELVNVGDLIQQMLDVFYESELVRLRISDRNDFLDPCLKQKKAFEALLDERVASGLSKGIDVLMEEVEYICATTQLPSDFNPNVFFDIGPTKTCNVVLDLVRTHTGMLTGATEKSLLDVFTGEIGLRLFQAVSKHIKRQRISTQGALPLISDLTAYNNYIVTFRNTDLNNYFTALREVSQIYLIEGKSDRDINEMASVISDGDRYKGIFTTEEVVEFAERRTDWLLVRSKVEKRVQGDGCVTM